MAGVHDERHFEDAVENFLLSDAGGYAKGSNADFDAMRGLDTLQLFTFIGDTQIEAWNRLITLRGGDPDAAQRKFAERLAIQIDARGTVDVLRHGVDDLGVLIRLAYLRPTTGLNPDLEARYAKNRLTVVRQLHYSAKDPARSVDLALFVNGLPVATAELKNPLTHQGVQHAMTQYRADRDPGDTTLGRRAVVHFAVDPDSVMMTTKLAGPSTRFLPFNSGSGGPGNAGGAGNPPGTPQRHATAYLWEKVWQRDAWLDLLGRFVHVEQASKGRKAKAAKANATTTFPRYHQWDAVRRLEADARANGSGHRYLVQHSAGSGKSNTIAWLAHRLSTLHDASDTKVFDKVVVITDRKVLDKQLQDTIYQFEHSHGLVAKVDQDSGQLAAALTGAEAKVVITTLQKFPFVAEKVAGLPGRRYAVLIDEAHSSQTGDAATQMKAVLTGSPEAPLAELEGESVESDPQDLLAQSVEAIAKARGPQPNLSLFAFTATSKPKTMELFGTPDARGKPQAFHLYSMRQAIEERFIMDVLASYTTYRSYYKLANADVDDPEVDKRKAAAKIAAFVSLHPEHVAQKAAVVVEQVRAHTIREVDGQGKAMVVCRSRLHALRMWRAIKAYADEHGYGDIGPLVAFSGNLADPDLGSAHPGLTESQLNGFGESETAQRFASPGHRVLVVADKFQTGFDQPLLHTMFVDKKLASTHAVQTLSRLNRIHPDKASTFVLDFVNSADDIEEAFRPYYETTLVEPTDPNMLFDARTTVEAFGVIRDEDVHGFAAAWFGAGRTDKAAHAALYGHLAPAVDRFTDLDSGDQEEFRRALTRFVSLYAFLSQILPLADSTIEQQYTYCRALAARLPKQEVVAVDVDVDLTHLRVARTGDHTIRLTPSDEPLSAFTGDGTGANYLPGFEPLSAVIERFNEAFGLELTDADRLHLEGIATDMVADAAIQQQAGVNSPDNFTNPFGEKFIGAAVDRMKSAEGLTYKILDDDAFQKAVKTWMQGEVYTRARVAYQQHCPIGELLGRGEDKHLEFKSTLRWDLVNGAKSKLLEAVVVKTVAGFLNSTDGGTLLIGVADDGSLVGLEPDYATLRKGGKADADLFQLHLTQLVANAVGMAAATNVTTQVHTVDSHDVCRVHVPPSGHPVKVAVTTSQGTEEKFFVRLNNGTRAIDDQTQVDLYVAQRWR